MMSCIELSDFDRLEIFSNSSQITFTSTIDVLPAKKFCDLNLLLRPSKLTSTCHSWVILTRNRLALLIYVWTSEGTDHTLLIWEGKINETPFS